MHILTSVLIGAIAGWLAGVIVKGRGFGLLVNVLLGIIGGFAGRWLLRIMDMGLGESWTGVIMSSIVGAIAVLIVARLAKD